MSLKNKRIVVTRALHQYEDFAKKLTSQNAIALPYPCIKIASPSPDCQHSQTIEKLQKGYFDWIIFTSQNTVYSLRDLIQNPLPNSLKIAAVGPSTEKAILKYFNRSVNRSPCTFDSESLALLFADAKNQKIFLPQSNLANPYLQNQLTNSGAEVTTLTTYQTIKGSGGISFLKELELHPIDAITFASPSAIIYFLQRLKEEGGDLNTLAGICIACMGHVTKKTAEKNGFKVNVCPLEHTVEDLIQAMSEYFS